LKGRLRGTIIAIGFINDVVLEAGEDKMKGSVRVIGAVVLSVALLGLTGAASPASGQGQSAEAAVKGRIEQKFQKDGLLVGNDIQVAVENQTVVLSGTVRTLAQKEQAEKDARNEAKGYRVSNDLALAQADLTPQQIAEAIMGAIEKSSDYGIFDYVGLGVTEQGVVTLKGWTYYPSSAEEFVRIAKSQPGVEKVDNEIRRPLTTDADRALRLQVARLIYIHPRISSFARMNGPIHIIVNNGVVTLGGTVEREADIDGFERLVRSNTGAINVINALQVKRKYPGGC
jgi:osmotically-inducible protein OsmY